MSKFFARIVALLSLALFVSLPASANGIQGYRIAAGDVLSISVFGEPELSMERVRVPTNGVLSYPLIGNISVHQATANELESAIQRRLDGGYLRDPQVTVSILEYRPFFVHGGVFQGGQQPYAEGMTVEKAIAIAGGLTEDGLGDQVTLRRESGEEIANVSMKAMILPGDILRISVREKVEPLPGTPGGAPIAEKPKQYLYFTGQVRTPGSYEYREGMSVRQALALAGGMTGRGSKRKVTITREPVEVDMEADVFRGVDLSEKVKPGDVIDVGAKLF